MTGFYMQCNIGLKKVNRVFTSMYDNKSNFIKTQLFVDANMWYAARFGTTCTILKT